MQPDRPDRKRVFISYSHQDAKWLKRLHPHLKYLEKRDLVDVWADTKITPGANWREEIRNALNSASVAVLLISANFIASDFIAENELPQLLAAAKEDGVVILPLILSPCAYDQIEHLNDIQYVNKYPKPLINLSPAKQEECLDELRRVIDRAIGEPERKTVEAGERESRKMLYHSIPHNKYFTGRENILTQLRDGFKNGNTAQALIGLGGVGKTQTAARYAREFRNEYKNIFWTTARSEETLIPSYLTVARALGLREKDSKDQKEAVGAVLRWIENHSGWLLVLDHAEDSDVTRRYIPSNQDGHVLLTTRTQVETNLAVSTPVEAMSPQEGALFILRMLGEIKLNEQLSAARTKIRDQAEELSITLGGIPLALDQAAAYMNREHLNLEEYLDLYKDEQFLFLKKRDGDAANDNAHLEPVAVTFQMSFKKVSEENPATADLLSLCAFLDTDAIPEEIFHQEGRVLGDVLGQLVDNKRNISLREAIGAGNRFSLIHRDIEKKTNRINRLVQAMISHRMSDSERRLWSERAVRAVSNIFPSADYKNWTSCDRLIRHAIALTRVIAEYDFLFRDAARMLSRAGDYLSARGRYNEAEPLYKNSLGIYGKAPEPENEDVAAVLSNLGLLSRLRGKYDEAETFYQRSLKIYEKSQGLEDLKPARVLNNLAQLYVTQGKDEEAEPLYNQSLKIIEKIVGSEHPDFAMLLNNLAEIYHKQGRDGEAESKYMQSLRILERHFEADNPYLANVLNNLAKHHRAHGRYAGDYPK